MWVRFIIISIIAIRVMAVSTNCKVSRHRWLKKQHKNCKSGKFFCRRWNSGIIFPLPSCRAWELFICVILGLCKSHQWWSGWVIGRLIICQLIFSFLVVYYSGLNGWRIIIEQRNLTFCPNGFEAVSNKNILCRCYHDILQEIVTD